MSELLADINRKILEEFTAEIADLIDAIEPEVAMAPALGLTLAARMLRCFSTLNEVAGGFGFSFVATLSSSAEDYLRWVLGNEDEIKKRGKDDRMILETFLKTFDLIKEIVKIIALQRPDSAFKPEVDALESSFRRAMAELRYQQEAAAQKGLAIKVELTEDLIMAFKAEAAETMTSLEQLLLNLCDDEKNSAALGAAFRDIHSFKGNCGIFGLTEAGGLSHCLESCLGRIREDGLIDRQGVYAAALQVVDLFKLGMAGWTGGALPMPDAPRHIATLKALLDAPDQKKVGAVTAQLLHSDPTPPPPQEELKAAAGAGPEKGQREKPQKNSSKEEDNQKNVAAVAPFFAPESDHRPAGASAHPLQMQPDVRVTVQKLDMLNNLAGELVTAKTMLQTGLAALGLEKSEGLEKSLDFLAKTINDLRDVAVAIRMTPLQGVFHKMTRIIHDLSARMNKKIQVEFIGEMTEIDKTIIERITDPIAHMVRNAIDHGLETTEQRIKAGKNETGLIRLSARHEGNVVWIIVEDDGKGLDRGRILAKACAQGLIEGDGAGLSDREVHQLVFQPGFSTAEEITDISGRGVGLDVVLQNVRDLNGGIEIESHEGRGTRFKLRLPLTLAIMEGMLFEVGGVKYLMPIGEIREIVNLAAREEIFIQGQGRCIHLRERVIPVMHLGEIFRLGSESGPENATTLMVIGDEEHQAALAVDRIIGQHQGVVKPLSGYFKQLKGIRSCSILGDGEVSIILESSHLLAAAA